MHFYNLVTVKDILPTPKLENADITEKSLDEAAAREMEKLVAAQKKEPDNFYISLCIKDCELSGNQFCRAVLSRIGDVMEPTNIYTEDPQYLTFYVMEDDLRKRFNTKKTDCVKLPNGKIRPINLNFKIIDGVVYQQCAGRLKHTIRTKKAKRLKALPHYPLNKAFKSAEEYFEYCGLVYDAKYKKYGCYMNPCGYWDWYVIGGRRPNVFLVSESCREYCSVNIEIHYALHNPETDSAWTALLPSSADANDNETYTVTKGTVTRTYVYLTSDSRFHLCIANDTEGFAYQGSTRTFTPKAGGPVQSVVQCL